MIILMLMWVDLLEQKNTWAQTTVTVSNKKKMELSSQIFQVGFLIYLFPHIYIYLNSWTFCVK